MKTIGMIVAVEMDAVLAKYGRAAGVETRGGFEVHRYEGGDFRLFIVNSGAGEIAAAAATELLIAAYGACSSSTPARERSPRPRRQSCSSPHTGRSSSWTSAWSAA